MAIITISRGCCSHGLEIAQSVAGKLNYTCIDREVLVDAASTFDVSERKLLKSLHDAPGVLERMTHGREKYIKMIRTALLGYAKQDNMVYCGHAGHLLLPQANHILKVRINADMEHRVRLLRQKRGLSRTQALKYIEDEDKHRDAWTKYLYRLDLNDPKLYDLILHLGHITLEDAAFLISSAVSSPSFATTEESRDIVESEWIKLQAESAIQNLCEADVNVHERIVHIRIHNPRIRKTSFITPKLQNHIDTTVRDELTREVYKLVKAIPGVHQVICDVDHLSYS